MHILITKDGSTKIPREVRDLDEARSFQLNGFHVELLDDWGNASPLPGADPIEEEQPAEPPQEPVDSSDPEEAAAAPAKKAADKRR